MDFALRMKRTSLAAPTPAHATTTLKRQQTTTALRLRQLLGLYTDATAYNYNPESTEDDGSQSSRAGCGCTDVNACNYDAGATIDDGSGFEPLTRVVFVVATTARAGCTDPEADNYFIPMRWSTMAAVCLRQPALKI